MISVGIVDDAAEVRILVRAQLSHAGRFTVVGEGSDGRDAIELARTLRPSVLLLDVSMPRMDGLEALPHIREVSPNTRVIMYTGFDEGGLAARAHDLGAAGLIEKSMALDDLVEQLDVILGPDDPDEELVASVDLDETPAPDPATAQQVLGEHVERFREVFEEAAIGMATMTLTGVIVRANKALAALVERDVRDLVGVPYSSVITETPDEVFATALEEAQASGGVVVRFEHRVDVADRPRWLLSTIAPVRDARGRALYLFLQAQDITAQRSTEDALRESEERFRLLVEAVQDYAIFMLDPGGHISSWNAGAQRIKGYRADEIIGKHFSTFYPPDKQQIRHPEHELQLALEHGHYEEEGWRIRKDGSRFWASVLITAVYNQRGEHVGFAKVTRDIDERRHMLLEREAAAAALSSANAGLEAANRQLAQEAADQAQFLAVTAHEIRSPIGVLTGAARLLGQHWAQMSEDERAELLQSMRAGADRLQRLLTDLLTASRLESNKVELRLQDVPLDRVVAASIASARAAAPDVDISAEPSGEIVRGDPDRLAQVLDNLIANAIRYGAPPIRVQAERRTDVVEVSVRDSGAGVEPEVQGRLFQRFATGSHRGGTGLGLFIVRELARAQSGDAWYVRDADTTAFVVSLPVGGATQ